MKSIKLMLAGLIEFALAPFREMAASVVCWKVTVAAGAPDYSGTFIPEIWSGKLVEKFYDATVFGSIANTDYEGEISGQGDKVNIRTTPTIEIHDYQKGGTLQVQRPESPITTLTIDKAKYFNFIIDSVDKYQSDINIMDDWSGDAGEQMKIVVDTGILGDIYASAAAANKGNAAGRKSASFDLGATGAPVVLTAANVVDVIIRCSTVADEQNWPEAGRWMVIPAWMRYLLMNSELKNASVTGDGKSVLRNGRIGEIDRWEIFMSNNLAVVSDGGFNCTHVIFGHKSGLTFASQMTEMDSLKAESTFGILVRGLNVYGYKVIKTESIGDLYVRKG
jgi:hypothetical protein